MQFTSLHPASAGKRLQLIKCRFKVQSSYVKLNWIKFFSAKCSRSAERFLSVRTCRRFSGFQSHMTHPHDPRWNCFLSEHTSGSRLSPADVVSFRQTKTQVVFLQEEVKMLFLLLALYFYPFLYRLSGHNGRPLIHKCRFRWHVWNITLLSLRTIHTDSTPKFSASCLQRHTQWNDKDDLSTTRHFIQCYTELFGEN